MVLACAVPTPVQTKAPARAVATIDFLIARPLPYVKKIKETTVILKRHASLVPHLKSLKNNALLMKA
jgi:hypothetical protein